MSKVFKIILFVSFILIFAIILALGINTYVVLTSKSRIINLNTSKNIEDIDCILILGAGIWGDKPSPMLEDRLLQGIELYKNGVSTKIIMSGDHGKEGYDEVNVMKKFAIDNGVPSEDIFMDHAGFSTYESMYRAKEIFNTKKIIVVTQKYHLYRSIYIGNSLGLECYGVGADPRKYVGQVIREFREIIARDKDFIQCIFKIKPKYLGDTIPVSGNGDITNDKIEI